MKKTILLLTLATIISAATAQIQLQKSSIISTSTTFVTSSDTNVSYAVNSNSGSDVNWDFTFLNGVPSDTTAFKNPDWFGREVGKAFPNATYATKDGDEYSFFQVADSSFSLIGNAEDTGSGPLSISRINLDIVAYPLSYGDTIVNAPELVFQSEDSLGIVPGPGAPRIDSLRVQAFIQTTFIAVGDGNIEFQGRTVEKVLQVRDQLISFPKAFAKIGGNWIEIDKQYARALNIPFETDTTNNMTWWSTLEKSGVPLVRFEFEQDGDTISEIDYVANDLRSVGKDKPSIKIEAYPNPTSNYIILDGVDFIARDIKIFDVTGKNIETKYLDSKNGLDMSNLKVGNYILMGNTKEGILSIQISKM